MKIGIFYTTGQINQNILKASLDSIYKAFQKEKQQNENIRIICSSLSNDENLKQLIENYGFEFSFFQGQSSKKTMTAQIHKAIESLNSEDIIFFLEHDVLYHEYYFAIDENIFDKFNYARREFIQISSKGFEECLYGFNPLFSIITKQKYYKKFLDENINKLKTEKDDICLEPTLEYFIDNTTGACHIRHDRHYTTFKDFFSYKGKENNYFGHYEQYANLFLQPS